MEDCGFGVEILPVELVFEILIRSPNESACRFKAVCKDWYSLISSNYFVSHYVKRRCQRTPMTFSLVFDLEIQPRIRDENFNSPKQVVVNAVSNNLIVSKMLKRESFDSSMQRYFNWKYDNTEIFPQASCHDLLLLSYGLTCRVINLQTRECFVLPDVPFHSLHNTRPSMIRGFKCGLLRYHDPNNISNGDGLCRFRVICVPLINQCFSLFVRCDSLESSRYNIIIYCSETRKWRVVNVNWYPLKLNDSVMSNPIIAHDRMLHWLNSHSLVSVDPFSDSDLHLKLGRVIELPSHNCSWKLSGVSGGHIRLVGLPFGRWELQELHVWDLQGCGNKSWLLAHKILFQGSALSLDMSYLAVHPYDTDVIFVMLNNLICSFNLQTEKLEEYHRVEHRKLNKPGMIADSFGKATVLLHQWFPSPLPSRFTLDGHG